MAAPVRVAGGWGPLRGETVVPVSSHNDQDTPLHRVPVAHVPAVPSQQGT